MKQYSLEKLRIWKEKNGEVMEKVKIIADSGCNIDLEMAKEYHISILPFKINFKFAM